MRAPVSLFPLLLLAVATRPVAANEVRNLDLGTSYPTIQQAMDEPGLLAGQTILVLPGTYPDAFTIDVDVTVKSGFDTDPTALTETVLVHTPAMFVNFYVNAGTLEGFTITGGPPYGDALGVFVAGTGTLTRCVVENVRGRGVTAVDSSRVLYNVIRSNAPCGILGGASGAGIGADDDALILGNVIEDNYGLCDWNCGTPAPLPEGQGEDASSLRGGGPLDGGGIIAGGNVRIVSNLIRKNCAQGGAGLYLLQSSMAVNNTVLRNKGEGAALTGSGVTFANNIVAFNINVGVQVRAGTPTIDSNLFWGNQGGNGTTGTDAILADPLLSPDDLRLRMSSPAVDAGDDAWVLAGDLDVNGRPRIAGDHVDVGADEFIGHLLQVVHGDAPPLTLDRPVPNPWTGEGEATFRFTLPAAGSVRLTVHDVLGRRVAERAAERYTAGAHEVRWDPGPLPSGYYFLRLITDEGAATRPWVVVR